MATTKIDLRKQGKLTSIEDALDAANLNFIAEEHELMTPSGIFAPEHKMIVRSDNNKPLGVVGKKYHATQNSLAMAFMDNIVQKNGFTYTEALSKDNGAVSVITAQSERHDEIKVGDEVARQIKIINGFNGKNSLSVEFTLLRLVCTNGMTRSERESIIRFKHTININNKLEVALKVFDESVSFHEDFIKKAKMLSQKSVDKVMVEKFINSLYSDAKQNDKKKMEIENLFQNGMGNKGETLWDLYSGATEYFQHHQGKDEKRIEYANFGSGGKLTSKAWDIAMELV